MQTHWVCVCTFLCHIVETKCPHEEKTWNVLTFWGPGCGLHEGINGGSSVVIYYAIMTLLTLVCSLFWPNLWSPRNAVIASCKSASRSQDVAMFQKHRGSLGSSPLENIIQQVMQHCTHPCCRTWFYQVWHVPGSTLLLTNQIWRTSLSFLLSVGLQSVFVTCTPVSFIYHVLWF